jgi:activator of HSP90 ATPase
MYLAISKTDAAILSITIDATKSRRLNMKIRTIKQQEEFEAGPHEIYEALMDSEKHGHFTGGKASIDRVVGGKFNTFDGYSEGENLELVPDEKIVQTWRASDWPENHYSHVTFSLEAIDGGTRLSFLQTGVPEAQCDDIAKGWQEYYWTPMKEMLEKK